MNKQALLELAARVERAEGADRGIDASVWLLAIEKPEPGDKIDGDMHGRWPAYTASLDAAMGLVPEGWAVLLATSPSGSVCDVHSKPLGEVGEWPGHARAATPAPALVSAALKALAAQENEL